MLEKPIEQNEPTKKGEEKQMTKEEYAQENMRSKDLSYCYYDFESPKYMSFDKVDLKGTLESATDFGLQLVPETAIYKALDGYIEKFSIDQQKIQDVTEKLGLELEYVPRFIPDKWSLEHERSDYYRINDGNKIIAEFKAIDGKLFTRVVYVLNEIGKKHIKFSRNFDCRHRYFKGKEHLYKKLINELFENQTEINFQFDDEFIKMEKRDERGLLRHKCLVLKSERKKIYLTYAEAEEKEAKNILDKAKERADKCIDRATKLRKEAENF